MKLTQQRQLDLYRKYARQARYASAAHSHQAMQEIIDLGERRAFGAEGIAVYGDSTWWKSLAQKRYESRCEQADDTFYWVTILAEMNGELG